MTSSWIILIAALLIAVTITAVECAPAEPDDVSEQNADTDVAEEVGKLRLITITHQRIEGEYYSSTGGIHFQSEINGEYHFLSVNTPEGEPIVMAKQYHETASLMTVTENNFLVMNSRDEDGHSKYSDYVVPGAYKALVDNALKRDHLSSKILRQLDDRNTNETRQLAFEDLALRDEIELITGAARSLGQLGITGSENPAALPFFVLTIRLQKYRDSLLNNEEQVPTPTHQKRQSGVCTYGSYPYGGYGADCFGMCGYGCYCWYWVCGDCCVHQGCYDHDTCCSIYGYWSWECWSVWNFSCSGYFC